MTIPNLDGAKWIWCESQEPNTYCHARGLLHLDALPIRGDISIAADSRYHLWVNGAYVGQGPTPFKRPAIFFDTFDVTTHLEVGVNVVAVLADYHGVDHCAYTTGPPGIVARLDVVDAEGATRHLVTDKSWKVLESQAYARDVPRRTWATAWCEYYDARLEPTDWTRPDFDASQWSTPIEVPQGPVTFFPRVVAPLEEKTATSLGIVGVWQAESGIPPVGKSAVVRADYSGYQPGLTAHLDTERLTPLKLESPPQFPLAIEAAEEGFAFCVDLGREISGHVEIEVEAPAGVVIDFCPTELLREGRPWCYRKKGEYTRRYTTRDGRQNFRGFAYDGIRYLHAVVRGPHPALTFHRLGAWQRESSLSIRATFRCDDPKVNRIWDITCHTMRVGSQEIHIDCPTREQTSAWGDAVWTGLWAAYLCGDISALRYLMLCAEHVQEPDGQMPCYAFSEVHSGPMFDYSLIFVWGIQVYLQASGDRDLAQRLIPVANRVLDWYRQRIGPSGLLEIDCAKNQTAGEGIAFIDHPGHGWHNCPPGHPGLDFRGINAALNFFFIHALEAQAAVLSHLGRDDEASQILAECEQVRVAAHQLFYNPDKGVYVDGYFEGAQSSQISQQTNSLAVTSGTCPPVMAQEVLARILEEDDSTLCLSGTYFWTYQADALCRTGMHRAMWDNVVRLWDAMAEQGATTWWETFLGDELDSLCHLWSSVPGYLILAEVLGVQPAQPGFKEILIRPRPDLLQQVAGSMPLPDGEIAIEWKMNPDGTGELAVTPMTNAPTTLKLPDGWSMDDVESNTIDLPLNQATVLSISYNIDSLG